jgi:hypothetical protein
MDCVQPVDGLYSLCKFDPVQPALVLAGTACKWPLLDE